jgi:hypothetical protein
MENTLLLSRSAVFPSTIFRPPKEKFEIKFMVIGLHQTDVSQQQQKRGGNV